MKVGVLGYGNLACALLDGLTKFGCLSGKDVTITAKTPETLSLACLNGLNASDSVAEIFEADIVILAVKPAVFKTLINEIPSNFKGKIVSAMACYSYQELKNVFKNNYVLRIMPSLLSRTGNDLIAVCGDTDKFDDFIKILKGAGRVIITNEEKFNAFLIAVSCGIGFTSYITEAYKNSLVKLGFLNEEANEITKVLFTASASVKDRVSLYKKVATKGGVTELGLNEFENGNLNGVIENGVLKAYNKVK